MWRLAGTGLNIYFVITYFMGQLGACLSFVWFVLDGLSSSTCLGVNKIMALCSALGISFRAFWPGLSRSLGSPYNTPCARFNNFIIFART